jgi:hypothetical protein
MFLGRNALRQILIGLSVAMFILSLLASVRGQSKPSGVKPHSRVGHPRESAAVAFSSYLTSGLELNQTNLGSNFRGHDIESVVEAIKKSTALKEKSEFEVTSAYKARLADFERHPLYSSVMPKSAFGFVIDEQPLSPSPFKYNADKQIMTITLTGVPQHFVMSENSPVEDTIVIRRTVLQQEKYVGTNAFGAKVEITETYSKLYGITFNQNNWLFGSSRDFERTFIYSFPMPLDQARTFKEDARIMLVCRLTEPWLRESASGHDPTINEPYKTLVDENYLVATPEQIWVFNQKTGDVIRKLSESVLQLKSFDNR